MKIVSTSAVLSALGADFRFRTPVTLEGKHQGDTFEGNLVVEASGDPSLGSWRFPETDMACEQIAEAMWGRGIRKWRGALQVQAPDTGLDGPLGPGWAWDDVAYSMSAAPMPFVFRENVVDLSLLRSDGAPCSAQPSLQVSPRFAPFPALVQIDTSRAERASPACAITTPRACAACGAPPPTSALAPTRPASPSRIPRRSSPPVWRTP